MEIWRVKSKTESVGNMQQDMEWGGVDGKVENRDSGTNKNQELEKQWSVTEV